VDADALLDALRSVDPELMRPLYALAIAEAACNGEDPTNWDSEKILEVMLDRELRFHHNCLRTIIGEEPSQTLYEEFDQLIVQLCVRGVVPLEDVSESDCCYLMDCARQERMNKAEFFRRLGLLRERNTLRLECPDLVKEYLVIKLVFNTGNWDVLLIGDWKNDEKLWAFLDDRLVINHTQRMKQEEPFLRQVMAAQPTQEEAAAGFAGLLWDITAALPALTGEAAARLEQLHRDFSTNQWIRLAFSAGLVNLTVGQELDGCLDTVHRLKELRDKFSEDPQIALQYARALYNLTVKQELDGRLDTVHKLKELRDKFSDDPQIALTYAMALVNLTVKQELDGVLDTVSKLEALWGRFSDNQEIAANYAGSLVTLAFRQKTEAAVRDTLKIAGDILSSNAENPEIQLRYTQVWFNLTLQQAEGDIPGTVAEIAAFLRGHPKAIPQFREALDAYLDEHPDHQERYKPLLDL
jgi:F0F1-type ATP synthase delta subunit